MRRELTGTALGSLVARALLIAAGLGLVIGFLLPWFSIGGAASISGLGLLVMRGEVVEMMTGPHRVLLFAVPLLGAALLVAGFMGHRIALWIALSAGIVVIGGGVYTLIRLFFDATGMGMWIVVVSALLSLSVALLTLGRTTPR
ncbi:MAG: hypothetical protein ACHQ53_07325 [Polyangiales bacterium]